MEILSDPVPDMLAMPRFDDGAIDMQELLRPSPSSCAAAERTAETVTARGRSPPSSAH